MRPPHRADDQLRRALAARAGEVGALCVRAADVAGAQRDGVRGVGVHGRHADGGHRRERDQRATAGDRVDDAGADRGNAAHTTWAQTDRSVIERGTSARGPGLTI